MGSYSKMMEEQVDPQASPTRPALPDDFYISQAPNARGGAEGFRARAMDVHQQLLDLERQYGNAAVIPKTVAHHIMRLAHERDKAINEWQQFDNQAVSDSDTTNTARLGMGSNSTYGKMLNTETPQVPGGFSKPLGQQLRERAQGLNNPAPVPKQPYTGGMNPTPAPAQVVQGKVFGDAPDDMPGRIGPGGTTPQFGHAKPKPFVKKPNPGMY